LKGEVKILLYGTDKDANLTTVERKNRPKMNDQSVQPTVVRHLFCFWMKSRNIAPSSLRERVGGGAIIEMNLKGP
jgi:hypothetical protein